MTYQPSELGEGSFITPCVKRYYLDGIDSTLLFTGSSEQGKREVQCLGDGDKCLGRIVKFPIGASPEEISVEIHAACGARGRMVVRGNQLAFESIIGPRPI